MAPWTPRLPLALVPVRRRATHPVHPGTCNPRDLHPGTCTPGRAPWTCTPGTCTPHSGTCTLTCIIDTVRVPQYLAALSFRTQASMSRRKPRGRPLDGWLIIDKPPGLTSTDVVNRREAETSTPRRPATAERWIRSPPGCRCRSPFGAATKTVPYVMDGTKLYRFTLRFGESRDTDDADGQVTGTTDTRPSDARIRQELPAFRGAIMQIPPIYSAIKIAGERAYDMARECRAPVLEARAARVDSFELADRPDPDSADIRGSLPAKASTCAASPGDLARACVVI